MKQVLQSLKTGETEVADVPCPAVGRGQLLIRTRQSLISAGTERMLVDFGKAGWIEKARQQPDKVRMVLDKVRTDGIVPTFEAVRNKLDQAIGLGYCNVGRVLEVGPGVTGYAVGDRVASNGRHAEVVSVPVNLCAKVPDGVSDDAAAFTVISAIGLQGLRLAQPTLGETFVVTGLGLIGLITVQLLLRCNGCRVIGLDPDRRKLDLAREMGAEVVDLAAGEDAVIAAQRQTRGRGVDAVLVTAATSSSEPIHQAAQMCRKRGRIVLIGVTGLDLSRADFYEKELTFQVSCSYGPGRHDPGYEERGQDYPPGFVRWTEQRNFEAVLDMLAARRLDLGPLISHRFAVEKAALAYDLIAGEQTSLGVMLEYPAAAEASEAACRRATVVLETRTLKPKGRRPGTDGTGAPAVAFIGSGNFATAVLMPAFKQAGAVLKVVASASGASGLHAGRKHGAEETTTSVADVLARSDIDAIVIATRHDSHARLVVDALKAGKHVFVEKPLAIAQGELKAVEQAYRERLAAGASPVLMVGFNRRFAPLVARMKSMLSAASGPKALILTVNAGAIPASHWAQDPDAGGGRIIGEACHFIDLLRYLVGAPASAQCSTLMDANTPDTASLQLAFADGSIGTIHYFANGNRGFPKERLEVFAAGRVLQLDNYTRLRGYGWPGFRGRGSWRQDKGHAACAAAFIQAVKGVAAPPIAFDEIMEVSRLAVELGSGGS